ncbi:MAG: hypothetical protein ACI4DU_01830 [Lachnospiraceae bacterium]
MSNYLKTYTGYHVDPLNPKEEDIHIRDIAHALSLNCRGNGQTSHFYSVAQHCINCAKEAKYRNYSPDIQLGCLLHDAAEAYLSDLIRPIKQMMDGYQKMEENFLNVVINKYGLSHLTVDDWEKIKEVDDDLLMYDLVELLNEPLPESGYHIMHTPDISFRPFDEVEREYLELFSGLKNDVLQEM